MRVGAERTSGSTSPTCSSRSPTPGSATAASAGSRRASSTRSRRSRYPRYGYGIRYEFGIFDQEIRNGWQVERPEEWLRVRQRRGRSRGPSTSSPSRSTAGRSTARTRAAAHTVRWVEARHVLGMPYDVPIAGLPERHRQHAAALARARLRGVRSRRLQRRRLPRGGRGQELLREHLEGPLPERPHRHGQGAPAPAAVLLRLLLHPRHRPRAT